jgi:large subunit ribosomal protein L25
MHTVQISGSIRTVDGKGGARRVRAEGQIPAVIYGAGEQSTPIALDNHELERIMRKHGGETFVLDLKIKGRESTDLTAIIKEMQRDPVSSRILHVDLQHVSMTQNVHVHVPVHIVGTAAGVKEGGILEISCREVEVECQVGQIPERIDVDVTNLSKGDAIHVRDLVPPPGVTVLTTGDRTVATIVTKIIEATPAEAAAAPAEEKKEGEEAPPAKG